MLIETILPSDKGLISLRRLALFEMDGPRPEVLGPYRYQIVQVDGLVVEDEYPLAAITTPPPRPVVEPGQEVKPHTPLWWQLMDWQRYTAAVAHEVLRLKSVREYLLWFCHYILDNCVLNQSDRTRIVDAADWQAILDAVIVPRISQEALADCFERDYAANFDGIPILEAIRQVAQEESKSAYDVIKAWEVQAINRAGLRFEQWIDLPYSERVTRVAGEVLPKLIESLELSARMKQ